MDAPQSDILALISGLRETIPSIDSHDAGDSLALLDRLEEAVRRYTHGGASGEEAWVLEMAAMSPFGMVRVSDTGRVTYANPQALDMVGADRSDVDLGLDLGQFLSPDEFDLGRVLQERPEGDTDLHPHGVRRLNRKDGTNIAIEVYGAPVLDPETGAVVGAWGMFRDVTTEVCKADIDRSRAVLQADLARATDLESAMGKVIEAALVLDAIDAGCVYTVHSPDSSVGIITGRGLSEDYMAFVDRWASEADDRNRVDSIPLGHCATICYSALAEDHHAIIHEEGLRALATVPLWRDLDSTVMLTVASRSQDEIPAETCSALEDMVDQVAGAVARVKAEEDRRKAVEQFEAVFHTSPLALYVLDLDGCVRMWNESASQMFGWEKEEVLYKQSPFIHADNRDEFEGNLQRALDGLGMYGQEFERPTRDGRMLNVRIYAAALRDNKGAPVGLLTIVQDVTELRQAAEVKQRVGLLESLGVLAGGIAHDFNNILMVITGNLSLAQMETDPNLLDELLGEAHDAARKAVGLTARLVTFAKGGTPVKEEIDLEAIVNRVVDRVIGGAPGIRSEIDLRATATVEADPVQLREALRSIVTNAKEAVAEQGGLVRISTEDVRGPDDSAYVRISIEDSGPGIPAGMEERIFDPYYSTKTAKPGLGLSAAHSVIAQHEGHIAVRPRPEGGSIFDVFLPTSSLVEVAAEPTQEPVAVEAEEVSRILVVDDEEMVRSVLVRMLERLGSTVVACSSGEEAVEVFRKAADAGQPFELAITDLTMPGGMNGVETAEALHDIDSHLRVVVSSGYSADAALAEYAAHGFCASVRKPYSLEALREVLDDCRQK